MYMEHHEITVSSVFSALKYPWDGDTSTNISVVYPWNSGHEHEMIVSCVVYQRLTCNTVSSVYRWVCNGDSVVVTIYM